MAQTELLAVADLGRAIAKLAVATDREFAVADRHRDRHIDAADRDRRRLHLGIGQHIVECREAESFRQSISNQRRALEGCSAATNGQQSRRRAVVGAGGLMPQADALIVADLPRLAAVVAVAVERVFATRHADRTDAGQAGNGCRCRFDQQIGFNTSARRKAERIRIIVGLGQRNKIDTAVTDDQCRDRFAGVIVGAGVAQAEPGASGNGARAAAKAAIAIERIGAVDDADRHRDIDAADGDGFRL